MGKANRLIGYVASAGSASLFYVIWIMAAFERQDTPKSDVTVLFRIGLAIFFLIFAGSAAFLVMALPWCLAVIVHDRWLPLGITYFALTGALTSFLIGCATSSLSPKPLFIEDQTFREGFMIAVQRQGICLAMTGLVFGSTFWLVSERLRPAVPR